MIPSEDEISKVFAATRTCDEKLKASRNKLQEKNEALQKAIDRIAPLIKPDKMKEAIDFFFAAQKAELAELQKEFDALNDEWRALDITKNEYWMRIDRAKLEGGIK